jgi:hypothetical protein
MENDSVSNQPSINDADVTPTSALPDIPDAGPDSQPISPPEPVDISTAALNTHAALAAGTLNDGDDRTLYEQTLDAYQASAANESVAVPTDFAAPATPRRRVQIYDARS